MSCVGVRDAEIERLDRIDVCPSLPHLPDALFTSIQGVPGDSGAPLVADLKTLLSGS
mgnify:CR=1 FL=1